MTLQYVCCCGKLCNGQQGRREVTKAILLYLVPLGCGGLWNAYCVAFLNLELCGAGQDRRVVECYFE